MIARIEFLLSLWGRWAIKRASGALGYPTTSPMFRDAPRGDAYGSELPCGFTEGDIVAVDAAVNRLPEIPKLVVIEVYQRGGSMREVKDRLGIHHKSLTQYLNQSHQLIDVDIAAQCAHNQRQFARVHQCAQTPQPVTA